MKTAFLIHGSESGPHRNWLPWAKNQLESLGYKVIAPQFPTPEGQNLENWLKVFEEYKSELNSESILIGHSLGVPFVLNILEALPIRIKAAFLVAGFYGLIGSTKYDPIISSFSQKDFNWEKIKSSAEKFFVFHSENDNIVPYQKGLELAEKLQVKITEVPNAGHMGTAAKFFEFPKLIEKVKILNL